MNNVLFVSTGQLTELKNLVAREIFEARLNQEQAERLRLPNPGFFEQRAHMLRDLLEEIDEADLDLERA